MPSSPKRSDIESPEVRVLLTNRFQEIRRRRQLIAIAEIEQRRVLPVRARAPAGLADRRYPGRFPVHDADSAGAQRQLNDVVHETLLASQRRRIPAMQRVFTQQVWRGIARILQCEWIG